MGYIQKASAQESKRQRIDYIDLFRAFGIIMMIMGHVAFGNVFKKWIHVFHMPMFFIISGFFWKNQPLLSILKKKARTLLIPYITFGILHLLIEFIRIGSVDTHAFYLLFWDNTAEGGIPIAGALWFLTAMFFSEVLFWCVQQLRKPVDLIVSIIIPVLGMACDTYLPFRLPLAFDVGMVGVGFYKIGNSLRGKGIKLLDLNVLISLVGMILFSILGFLNGYVNLRQGMYSIWPLFWINAVGMSICLWNLSRWIYGWLEKKLDKPIAWIKSIGRNSIIYLCLNQLMIMIAGHMVEQLFSYNGAAVLLVKKTVILIICFIELYVVQQIITRTKLKALIGKWE